MLLLASSVCELFKGRQFEHGGHPACGRLAPALLAFQPTARRMISGSNCLHLNRPEIDDARSIGPAYKTTPAKLQHRRKKPRDAVVKSGLGLLPVTNHDKRRPIDRMRIFAIRILEQV